MSKNDPVENALDRLGELRHADTLNATADEVRKFLRNRSNLVVAKAAKIARELRLQTLLPDLLAAFSKLMADAPRLDKRCVAITEIIGTLYEFDLDEAAPYLAGIKHRQLEASFGAPVDEAAKLRGLCAQGLLRTRYPDALAKVVPLLVDSEPDARIGAVRALALNGGETGVLLLRLKVLTGDAAVEVLGECFAGLLAGAGDKSIPFVASYIDSDDDAIVEVASLALGESRLPRAFEVLQEKWGRTVGKPMRQVLLVAMATSRLDEAIAFMLALLEHESVATATLVLEALAIYRLNERITELTREVVSRRGDRAVAEKFRQDFER